MCVRESKCVVVGRSRVGVVRFMYREGQKTTLEVGSLLSLYVSGIELRSSGLSSKK